MRDTVLFGFVLGDDDCDGAGGAVAAGAVFFGSHGGWRGCNGCGDGGLYVTRGGGDGEGCHGPVDHATISII